MEKKPRNRTASEQGLWLVIVGLAAWIVPGAGHWLIRERKRAVILFAVITGLFVTGLYIGSVGVVDWVGGRIWFYAQILCSPAVGILGNITQNGQYPAYGRPCDIGQLYTGIAGLLNLLCILSAVYMAYCGRGEMIGREDEDHG
ncbi:MAG: hypothetical protein L0Y36_03475 [Planctomycetales bacterium]|nr:hypothetical protein [Planctomycetales bacterium]